MNKLFPDAWMDDFRKWASKNRIIEGSYYKEYIKQRMG